MKNSIPNKDVMCAHTNTHTFFGDAGPGLILHKARGSSCVIEDLEMIWEQGFTRPRTQTPTVVQVTKCFYWDTIS